MKRFIAIAVGAALCGPAGALAYEETTETRLSVEVKPGAPAAQPPSVEERTHESTTIIDDDGEVKKKESTTAERTVRQQAAPPPPPSVIEKRTLEVERTED